MCGGKRWNKKREYLFASLVTLTYQHQFAQIQVVVIYDIIYESERPSQNFHAFI